MFVKNVKLWNTKVPKMARLLKSIIKDTNLGIMPKYYLIAYDDAQFEAFDIHDDILPKDVYMFFKLIPNLISIVEKFDIDEAEEGDKLFLACLLVMMSRIQYFLDYAVVYVEGESYDPKTDKDWFKHTLQKSGFDEKALSNTFKNTVKFLKANTEIKDLEYSKEEIRRMRLTLIKAFKI